MKLGCFYCKGEREPGFIEMPNNGPIVGCPYCNKNYSREKVMREIDWEMALAERAKQARGVRS